MQTIWGPAAVHRSRINGDLELKWPTEDETIHKIPASKNGTWCWLPDERPERYSYEGKLIQEEETMCEEAPHASHELNAMEMARVFEGGKFMGYALNDLVSKVSTAAVNAQ